MYCNKCGFKYNGNFCPICGAKAKKIPDGIYQIPASNNNNSNKQKNSFKSLFNKKRKAKNNVVKSNTPSSQSLADSVKAAYRKPTTNKRNQKIQPPVAPINYTPVNKTESNINKPQTNNYSKTNNANKSAVFQNNTIAKINNNKQNISATSVQMGKQRQVVPPTPPQMGKQKQVVPPTPPQMSKQRQVVPPTPPQMSKQRQVVPPNPPQMGKQKQVVPPTPPQMSKQRQVVPPTPPQMGKQKQVVPPKPPQMGKQRQVVPPNPPQMGKQRQVIPPTYPQNNTNNTAPQPRKGLGFKQILIIVIAGILTYSILNYAIPFGFFACADYLDTSSESGIFDEIYGNKNEKDKVKIGETFDDEIFSYTVTEVKEVKAYENSTPDQCCKYISVTVNIKNIDDYSDYIYCEVSMYADNKKCKQLQNKRYADDQGELLPDNAIEMTYVFEVPENAEKTTLLITDYVAETTEIDIDGVIPDNKN